MARPRAKWSSPCRRVSISQRGASCASAGDMPPSKRVRRHLDQNLRLMVAAPGPQHHGELTLRHRSRGLATAYGVAASRSQLVGRAGPQIEPGTAVVEEEPCFPCTDARTDPHEVGLDEGDPGAGLSTTHRYAVPDGTAREPASSPCARGRSPPSGRPALNRVRAIGPDRPGPPRVCNEVVPVPGGRPVRLDLGMPEAGSSRFAEAPSSPESRDRPGRGIPASSGEQSTRSARAPEEISDLPTRACSPRRLLR